MNEPILRRWAGVMDMPLIARSGRLVAAAEMAPSDSPLDRPVRAPELGYWALEDALVSPTRPGAVTASGFALPHPVRPSESEPSIHSIPSVLLKDRVGWKLHHLPAGIHVSGRWPYNFYHWMVEILPKVHLARRLPDEFLSTPLILPQSAMSVRQLREGLQLMGWPGGTTVVPDNDYLQVDRLVVLDGLPSLVQHPDGTRQILHLPAMRDFVAEILGRLALPEPGRPRMGVHLARPRGSRRAYNRSSVTRTLRREGLRILEGSRSSLREQISAAAHADLLVGAAGAAMTNSLFASDAAIVSWATHSFRADNVDVWSSIAVVGGNRFHEVVFPDAPVSRRRSGTRPYRVNRQQLRRAIVEARRGGGVESDS